MTERCDVAIVGAGPVGLLLACLLAQRGIEVRVLEQRAQRSQHSRAIGVHPPGLMCLARASCADALIARGVRVQRGQAMALGQRLGAISFSALTPPYDFVLSVPQRETERVLERRLAVLAPHALKMSCCVHTLTQQPDHCQLVLQDEHGARALEARIVVGCDGKASTVRAALGASFAGGPYPQCFLMGDAADDTSYGEEACVFFDRAGLVESFPLPQARRRWVVGTRHVRFEPDARVFRQQVEARTGQRLRPATIDVVSAFVAERYRASCFARGRLALAGDAAHIVSPIGGQGMNLGWLDAQQLAQVIFKGLRDPQSLPARMERYDRQRRRAAWTATLRAELYMALGCRGGQLLGLRSLLVSALLKPPLADRAARFFTMQSV